MTQRRNKKSGDVFRKAWAAWVWLLPGLLISCAAPLPAPSPVPSLQPLRLSLDPALQDFQALVPGCIPPGLALYYTRMDQPADVHIWLADPDSLAGDAFLLSRETLVPVIHPTNPLASLTLPLLRAIYSGKYSDWDPIGGPRRSLSPWTYPAGSSLQRVLDRALFRSDALSAQVGVVPGPAELRAAIAADPGGIGFLPRRWLDRSVKEISIEDAAPGAFSLPLLAETTVQPQGSQKEFLLCLQEAFQQP